ARDLLRRSVLVVRRARHFVRMATRRHCRNPRQRIGHRADDRTGRADSLVPGTRASTAPSGVAGAGIRRRLDAIDGGGAAALHRRAAGRFSERIPAMTWAARLTAMRGCSRGSYLGLGGDLPERVVSRSLSTRPHVCWVIGSGRSPPEGRTWPRAKINRPCLSWVKLRGEGTSSTRPPRSRIRCTKGGRPRDDLARGGRLVIFSGNWWGQLLRMVTISRRSLIAT